MTHRAPELHTTEDGSLTLYAPTFGEHYHSMHGAVQESEHIYLGLALRERMSSWQEGDAPLRLFEVGFGTGLNALLSWREAEERHIPLQYYSIEKFPLTPELYEALHYEAAELSPFFTLHKLRGDLTTCTFPRDLSVIYYDAFSPESQPELWAEELFQRLGQVASSGAILSTYCAKGEVRRRLQRSGFLMERLPGPPGKREVLRGRIP